MKKQNNCYIQTDGESIYYFCSYSLVGFGCHFYVSDNTCRARCLRARCLNAKCEGNYFICTSKKAIQHLKNSIVGAWRKGE
jgi:hypothetical protein